jgi:DMSO/TMAO reductase YedYZ heme-binding membrane subunit
VGIIAAYAALLFGPSFYLRRRIGVRRWRKVHSLLMVAWLMSGVHTLGAGSDGRKLWLEAIVAAPVVPIVYLLVLRVLRPEAGAVKAVASAKSPGAAPVMRRPARATEAAEAAGA